MGELLKKILSLREDINNLTETSNEKVYEYCQLAIKIADTEDQIKNMNSTKSDLEESIMDFKLKKGIFFTWPIGALLSILYFYFLIIASLDKITLGLIIFTIIGTPAFSIVMSFALSAFLMHSKIFTNYLIKNYSHLKKVNERLNNLIVKIRITEKSLINIKNRKEEITNIIVNNEDIIESKKEELNKLEKEYFNNFNNINNPSITNSTNYEVSTTGKKRTRTIGDTK